MADFEGIIARLRAGVLELAARLKSWLNGDGGCQRFVELTPRITEPTWQATDPESEDDGQMWEEVEPEEDPQPARYRVWEGAGE